MIQNVTTFYTTLQHFTQLYTTSHNLQIFTQVYTTSRNKNFTTFFFCKNFAKKKLDTTFQKKTFQNTCRLKKEWLLLHPLTNRLVKNKKVRHVPRHIELTAVPKEISEQ